MRIRTSRIGLVTVRATAPVLRVDLTETHLEFDVGIDRVDSGNPLLDPELHALVRSLTRGVLTYRGRREGDGFRGDASAGEITVPLDLRADDSTVGTLALAGRCEFSDVDVPITWIGHLPHLAVDIDNNPAGVRPPGNTRWRYPVGERGGPMQLDEHTKKAQIHRLRRIEGQVRGLQRLIEDESSCVDVLTQVSATTRALESFAIQLVEQHMQSCVQEATAEGADPSEKIHEITEAIARLVRS